MKRVNDPTSAGVILRNLPRVFDDLPIWAQLNITWKCNLDCAYCSEYDNSKDHIPYDELLPRIDKIKELGTLHCDLIGGEPMLHPELIRLMHYVTHHHGRLKQTPNIARFLDRVRWLKQQKSEGRAISTPFYLIEYYERALNNRPMDWTCQAGNKCFYVSADGNFQFCYHVPSTRKLLD